MRTLSEKTFSAALIVLVGTGLYFVITITVQSFIGHKGGPFALGRYHAALMVIEFVATVILLGTPSALNRESSLLMSMGKRQETRSLLSGLLVFIVVASLLVGAVIAILFNSFQNLKILETTLKISDLFIVMIGSLSLGISKSVATFYHADFKNIKGQAITLTGPLITAVLVFLIFSRIYPMTLVQAVCLGFVASAIFSIALSSREGALSVKPQWGQIRNLIVFSSPLFGVSIVAFFSVWLDRIIVGMARGIMELGVLSSAVVIVRAIRFIPQSLTPVFVTTYSRILSNETRHRRLSEAFSTDLLFVNLYCLSIATAIYMWAPTITLLLWGQSFGNLATTILRIQLLGTSGLAYSLQTPNFLVVMGRPDLNFRLAVIHVAIQFSLSIVLLRIWGIVGVVLGTSTTLIIMAGVRHWVISHKLGVEIRVLPIKKLIAAFGISVVFYHAAGWPSWLPSFGLSILGSLVAASLFLAVLFSDRSTSTALKNVMDRLRRQGK